MRRHLGFAIAAVALAMSAFAAEVPRPSPDLAITFPGGKQAHLSEYRGKVVVLTFISTT